jgi:mono/diheme cytochrome c family protein/plastocyanin
VVAVMKRSELVARIVIITGVLLTIAAPLYMWKRTPLIHARMSEEGGWTPDTIKAEVGEPLQLHFTSDDVMHGFAIGRMDMNAVDIEPGKVTDVTITFDKPGIYTFFCTRWCGVNHWRMRGTIEVSGDFSASEDAPIQLPLYVALGLDIDAPHESPVIPEMQPSAIRGEELTSNLTLDRLVLPESYKSTSPYQIFQQLGPAPLSDSEKWDVVAYLWQTGSSPESIASGKKLYSQNCAACHGENGAGDGVFADDIAAAGEASMESMSGAMDGMMQAPADFTNPKQMLGASPAVLQGKILRGGMGTGMPMWGSIFTEEQIWALVAYLYSFQFEYKK